MSGEEIMDALGYLDDDLIEATDKLRQKKRGLSWLVPAATAACLCIILIALIAPSKATPEAMQSNDGSNFVSDVFYGADVQESPMEAAGTAAEIVMAVLQVTEITETGFSGIEVDTDMTIEITCSSDITVLLVPGDLVQVYYGIDETNSLIELEIIGK